MILQDEHGNYTATNARASEIIELARKIIRSQLAHGPALTNPRLCRDYLALHFADQLSEVFTVIFLDNRHSVIAIEDLFFGTIDGTSVHPREVVRKALEHNAAAVILSHNHPSGIPEPSQADKSLTDRLNAALKLIDVRVLDHIVIGGVDSVSFAEKGFI